MSAECSITTVVARSLGSVLCLVLALCARAHAREFPSESPVPGCASARDMAQTYRCESQRRDEQRAALNRLAERIVAAAKSSRATQRLASNIEGAEKDWTTWMDSECALEGLLDGGAAAPTPWLERCEIRMMAEHMHTLHALGAYLDRLASARQHTAADGH